MVYQPAYLANLKSLGRRRWATDDEATQAAHSLPSESDRGAIILSATTLEDMLEYRILDFMPVLKEDETTRKQLFEVDGPIASFSRKINVAYALGIIDAPYRKLIDLVREIRNACAHSRHPVSLATPELRAACEVLIADTIGDIKDHEPQTIRNGVLIKIAMLCHYVQTGEKIEGADAQLVHYAKALRDA